MRFLLGRGFADGRRGTSHGGQRSVVAAPPTRPVHGGIKPAELRALALNPEEVLDFSASVSPLGPPAGVWEAMHRVDLTAYPDPQCVELREAICGNLAAGGRQSAVRTIGVDGVLVGNGSTELIHLLARAYLSTPPQGTTKAAFLLIPTYGEYQGACQLLGASVSGLEALAPGSFNGTGFHWDMEEACRRIAAERPALVFICDPNNPTGVYLRRSEVESLVRASGSIGGLLVLDQAYLSFVDDPWDSLGLLEHANVVLLRSMTKDYALTGLRLGYTIASPEVTARMAWWQPDWSVNALAQAAGLAVLGDTDYLGRARLAVEESKAYLTSELTALGYTVTPSAANFLLVQVGNGKTVCDTLVRSGLFVRDCASFGLPEYIRIGIRALTDCQRLVEALQRIPRRLV